MSIFYKDREVSQIPYGTRFIGAVYYGSRLVWQAIRSCYGKGYWVSSAPWSNTDSWKNG